MKVVIIILVLVVVGFAVAIGVAVYRATTPPAPPSAHGPPTGSDGKVDKKALADWKPPPIAAVMGRVSRPFAPKLFKEAVEVTGQAGSGLAGDKPGEVQVPPADKGMRIARLRLIEGKGAVAIYQCVPTQEGETCPQRVCLCPENRILETDEVSECEETWRDARSIGDGQFRCHDKDDDVSAVIYRLGGAILVTPMGDLPARVSVR